jgi:replicative DNA helicase
MIVDSTVLARISSKWPKQKGLFKTKWANTIAQWCLDYFRRYEKAPMKHIENLYEAWATKVKDETTIKLVEKFLDSLSSEYQELKQTSNTDYIIDLAGVYFNTVQLERLTELVKGNLEAGRTDDAHNEIVQFNKIELGGGEGINILQDKAAIKEAFTSKAEPLIKYPGALGKFLKDAFERDGFIAFMAPEKRGKSFWLLDVAYRAVLQKRKVAFFEAGDMSQNQVTRRLMTRVAKRPLKRCLVKYPYGITKDKEEKEACVKTKTLRFKTKLTYQEAWLACKKVMRLKLKTKEPLFKMSCHPNSTLSIRMIKGILLDWEREGWVPDVIVIDYADILDMDEGRLEGRDRINEVWKQMRGLSQLYHCLVVTATQADAGSYEKQTMGKSNFSEDKRKHAHVTGMIGINQTSTEKENQIMRLNWIDLREGEYNEKDCVHVGICLGLGLPSLVSCF